MQRFQDPMPSEPFTTRRETSTNGSDPSTNQRQASYATERATVLFGGYRRGDANDPDTYVASIAAVLALYEPELMREVTDPRTGISQTEKYKSFMPHSGELKSYCDAEQARKERIKRYAAMPRPLVRLSGPKVSRANVLVRFDRAKMYAAAVAASQAEKAISEEWRADNEGIFVTLDWALENGARAG